MRPLYERLLRNIEIMLEHGIVHGDLSAYNVLYWEGQITLIDFPQVVSPTVIAALSRSSAGICGGYAIISPGRDCRPMRPGWRQTCGGQRLPDPAGSAARVGRGMRRYPQRPSPCSGDETGEGR